jgi:hypothetical protein
MMVNSRRESLASLRICMNASLGGKRSLLFTLSVSAFRSVALCISNSQATDEEVTIKLKLGFNNNKI